MSLLRNMLVASGLAFFTCATAAHAGDSSLLVRARAVYIKPDVSTDPNIDADVDNKTIPEVDFSYFFTSHLATELILTYPQRHDVSVGGSKIGSVQHLPPTLTVQYHFDVAGVRPYAGIGLNYTWFTDVDLADGALKIDRTSLGLAYQVGLDIPIKKGIALNVDVKKVMMETDVKDAGSGAKVTSLTIDPWLIGLGIGWYF